jgi:hypothetical protein
MEQSARDKFFERIEAAPLAARGFFESVNRQPILTPYRRAILTPLRCGNQGLSRRS